MHIDGVVHIKHGDKFTFSFFIYLAQSLCRANFQKKKKKNEKEKKKEETEEEEEKKKKQKKKNFQ
jgi:hypothetical protein